MLHRLILLSPLMGEGRGEGDKHMRHFAAIWHFGIVHDSLRNETCARALAHHVRPGMRVFEIGTGLLAMLAVRGIEAGSDHHPEPESDQGLSRCRQ